MIATKTPDRKARFKAALALSGLTAAEWAAEHDLTAMHLSLVLHGKRESVALTSKIDAFIREQLGDVAA